ncbi:MAG: L,D-transpeptidase family protein [Terrimicrobiaceae bacterium]|nr:L,D-transpeptidase family protein [Terrimicrobiaceae bacterium]
MSLRQSAIALAAAGLLAGCAGFKPHNTTRDSLYSTLYLSPDGRVVPDPRARTTPKPPAKDRRKKSESSNQPTHAREWFWKPESASGPPSIVIRLAAQRADFYMGGRLVGQSPVSTGREGYRTPAGQFRVTQKNAAHVSNLYGDYVDAQGNVVMANVGVHKDPRPPGTVFRGAPMPYFMRVHGAVGMHAGYLPGYPASHGCIRLPPEPARLFFENAPLGTPVRIVY